MEGGKSVNIIRKCQDQYGYEEIDNMSNFQLFLKLIQYKVMIIPYNRTNKAGQKEKYYTHSSYIDTQQFDKALESHKTASTYRNYLGLLGLLVGLKLSTVPAVAKTITPKIPALGFAGIVGAATLGIGHLLLVRGGIDRDVYQILDNSTVPLWRNKNAVVALNRCFFHLNESKHNQPDLNYHGLSPERAAAQYPDLVIGPAPKAPEVHSHGHGHGHGHGHENSHGHDHGHGQEKKHH